MSADPSIVETVGRVLLAVAVGGIVGLEREVDSQPAGFRTHVLVSLGAALFTVAGLKVVGADPARVAAQVASGIGFLGAGAILRDAGRVRGLTTAASLWVTAALGLAAGLGAYVATVTAAVITIIVLVVLKRIERTVFPRRRGQDLEVDVTAGYRLTEVMATVEGVVGSCSAYDVLPTGRGGERVRCRISLPETFDPVTLAEQLRSLDGVDAVAIRI